MCVCVRVCVCVCVSVCLSVCVSVCVYVCCSMTDKDLGGEENWRCPSEKYSVATVKCI